MRIFLPILILCGFFNLSHAQVKHEIKLPVTDLLLQDIIPTYELVTQNEKIGIELGLGLDLSKVTARNDMLSFGTFEKFKSRVFESSLELRYYWYYNLYERYFSFFVGPTIHFDRTIFLEDEYIELRNKDSADLGEVFVGKKEIITGISGGFKIIFKNNLSAEFRIYSGMFIEERIQNNLSISPSSIAGGFGIKLGYRFGDHPLQAKEE